MSSHRDEIILVVCNFQSSFIWLESRVVLVSVTDGLLNTRIVEKIIIMKAVVIIIVERSSFSFSSLFFSFVMKKCDEEGGDQRLR